MDDLSEVNDIQSEGDLLRLSPYLWNLMLILGRWCQNCIELKDTQLVLENWSVWGKTHTFGVSSGMSGRKTTLFPFSLSAQVMTGNQRD